MFKFNLPKHLSMKDSPSMDSHLKTEIYNTYDGTPPSPTRKAMSPASPHNTSFSSTGGFLSPIPDSPGRTVRAATGKNVPGPAGSGPFAIKPRDNGGDEDVPMDFSQYLSDAHLSTTKPLIDSHLLGLSLHPAIRQANAAEASSSTAASTVAVYAPGRNTCANLAKSLNPDFKRVLKSFTSSECIAQIRRNNSDPLRTRNSVRLIVANLDQSALSILSHVESRLSDPLLRRMPVIPVLLTVSSGTLTAALSRTRGGQMAQQLDLLAAALEHRVVCGYVCDTVPAADLVRIMGSVIGRSAGVFAAYADLRVSRTEFTYPSYRGDQENDDGEEEEEGENGGEADGPPVKEITPRSMTLQKAWAKTSDHTGGSIMKRMSSGVLSVNKSSALATKILMGGTFQGARMETKMRKKPKKVSTARPWRGERERGFGTGTGDREKRERNVNAGAATREHERLLSRAAPVFFSRSLPFSLLRSTDRFSKLVVPPFLSPLPLPPPPFLSVSHSLPCRSLFCRSAWRPTRSAPSFTGSSLGKLSFLRLPGTLRVSFWSRTSREVRERRQRPTAAARTTVLFWSELSLVGAARRGVPLPHTPAAPPRLPAAPRRPPAALCSSLPRCSRSWSGRSPSSAHPEPPAACPLKRCRSSKLSSTLTAKRRRLRSEPAPGAERPAPRASSP